VVVVADHLAAFTVKDHHRRGAAPALPTRVATRVRREVGGVDGRTCHGCPIKGRNVRGLTSEHDAILALPDHGWSRTPRLTPGAQGGGALRSTRAGCPIEYLWGQGLFD